VVITRKKRTKQFLFFWQEYAGLKGRLRAWQRSAIITSQKIKGGSRRIGTELMSMLKWLAIYVKNILLGSFLLNLRLSPWLLRVMHLTTGGRWKSLLQMD